MIGEERRAVAKIGIPERQVSGVNDIQRKFPPGIELEHERAPIQHAPAQEKRGKENQRRSNNKDVRPMAAEVVKHPKFFCYELARKIRVNSWLRLYRWNIHQTRTLGAGN